MVDILISRRNAILEALADPDYEMDSEQVAEAIGELAELDIALQDEAPSKLSDWEDERNSRPCPY
jgi:hypothetical protein